jgi:hypothetical protein
MPNRFEVEYEDVLVIVGEYDEQSGEIGIEDVVNPDTGEVLTDEWFETGDIYDPGLRKKIENEARGNELDSFLEGL